MFYHLTHESKVIIRMDFVWLSHLNTLYMFLLKYHVKQKRVSQQYNYMLTLSFTARRHVKITRK